MLNSHLKTAFRNLSKHRTFSLINLFGLTVGLASFLLIALYLFDELTFDAFHSRADSIYRIVETKTAAEGKQTKVVSVAANISTALKKDFPEVENATRFSAFGRVNVRHSDSSQAFYEPYVMADSSFFSVFDFQKIEGDLKNSLMQPYSAVLTDEMAKRVFGRTAVTGETMLTEGDSTPYKITAVIHIPANSHLQFDILFSESTLYAVPQFATSFTSDWTSNNFVTYVLLSNDRSEATAAGIGRMVAANRPKTNDGQKSSFALQPLKDIHFRSGDLEGNTETVNITHIYVFGIVAVFVLLIACINYINLTTARFSSRAKEIAVRKVAGASRKNLVKQFLTEASLLTFISLILALAVVKFVLPEFNAFTEKQLDLGAGTDPRIWLIVLATAVFVGIAAGLYPAFYQSGLRPNILLKGSRTAGKGNLSIRKTLVVFQFALSVIMIAATIVVWQQMKFVDNTNMGFNKEQLLVVDINSGLVRRSAASIKAEFEKISGVSAVSVTSRVPGEWKVIPKLKVKAPGRAATPGEDVFYMAADEQFLPTFGVSLAAGRNFSATGDSANLILNETAAKMFGIDQPAEQMLEVPSLAFSGNTRTLDEPFRGRVVGIVKDFNFQSMREKVGPMVIGYQNNPLHNIDYFTSKVAAGNTESTLKRMEEVLRKIDGSHLFEYNFLDKQWELFYRQDQKRQMIFLSIALLTIIIACLGLFGLAAYAAEQRVKEIGIRKVLGAGVSNIVGMLSQDFARPVLIASLIAIPVSWWAMNNWLNDFAYRIRLSWWVFAAAAVLAFVIAVFTVSFQALKAALANPVKSLRTE